MDTRKFLFTALAVIAPKYALNVMRARMLQRVYEGAQTTPSSDWQSIQGNTSANKEIEGGQKTLINRSRDLARNNPYALKAQDVIVSNTIGSGIVPKITGRTKRQQRILRDLWKEVAETTLCDIERRHNFYSLQCLAMNTVVESGEVIAIKSITTEAPSIQLLEPDFIDESKKNTGNEDGTGRIVNGISLDRHSRRKSYHLFQSHPGDLEISSTKSREVSADKIIHVYKQTRPGQLRGVPWAHAVIETLKDFADFQYATIIRQKISACLVGVITTSGNDTLLTAEQQKTKRKNETKMTPGSFRYAGPGESVEFSNPPSSQGYGEFISETIRGVSAGYGVTYESISNDYSKVNFSSGRMGHLQFKKNIEKWRWHMIIPHFCDPYWELFLKWAQAKGVDTTGVKVEWVPPAFAMIDPIKEINADKEAIKAGLKSKSMVIREQGLDPDMVRKEIIEERAEDSDAGLTFDVYITETKSTVEDDEDDEDDDNTNENENNGK